MTAETDMLEAAKRLDELAREQMDKESTDAIMLYALARRLRQHAKQAELKDARRALQRLINRTNDLATALAAAGVPVPPLRTPTPPPGTPLATAGR